MIFDHVVITGAGIVSPLGLGRDAFNRGIAAGHSPLAPSRFTAEDGVPLVAGEVKDFDVEPFLKGKKTYLDPASEFALGALALCIEDAGLPRDDLFDCGLSFGSAFASLQTMELFYHDIREKGPRYAKPFLFPHTYPNTAVSLAAIEFEIAGPHLNFSAGSTSAAHAILAACNLVQNGEAERIFCGGYEALSESLLAGAELNGELSLSEQATPACGPFGKERNGYFASEGAAVFLVEHVVSARKRKARVLARITAAEWCGDNGIDSEDGAGEGVARAIRRCAAAGAPDLILSSANGSLAGDRSEALGIRRASTELELQAPVCPIKALTGEALGAGTGLQLAAAAAMFETGSIPRPAAYQDIDPELSLRLTDAASDDFAATRILLNSIDPGGSIACMLLSKPEGES